MKVKVGVSVRDFVGDVVGVRVLVGVGRAAKTRLHPFPSLTVKPKKYAETIPGQPGSVFTKSKPRFCEVPAFKKSVALGWPDKVQVTGDAELVQVEIKLPPKWK